MSRISAYQKQFAYYRLIAEQSIAQISENLLFDQPSEESNSIAVIMKHMAGNMLSRWTDVFESDGEKSWRNREEEFINTFSSKEDLLAYWNSGWDRLENTLEDLTEEDLDTIVYIRNMGCTLHDAILRQISHYAYHVGQIVFASKLLKVSGFQSLSIPRGASKSYNNARFAREKKIKHFADDVE